MNIAYIFTMAKSYQEIDKSFTEFVKNESLDEDIAAEVWCSVAHSIDDNDPIGNLKSLNNKMTKAEMLKQCEFVSNLPVMHEWEES